MASTILIVGSILLTVVGASLALLGVWNGYTWFRMRSLSPVDVTDAEDGLVEISGTVAGTPDETTYSAPYTGVTCIGYSYKAQALNTDGGDKSWSTAAKGSHIAPFILKDDTGTALINPQHATVSLEKSDFHRTPETLSGVPDRVERALETGTDTGAEQVGPIDITTKDNKLTSVGGYRFTESRLSEGDEVRIVGPATSDPTETPSDGEVVVSVENSWRYWGPFQVSDQKESITERERLSGAAFALLVGTGLVGISLYLLNGVLT